MRAAADLNGALDVQFAPVNSTLYEASELFTPVYWQFISEYGLHI